LLAGKHYSVDTVAARDLTDGNATDHSEER
jgi:hypothetical protein